ncbi:hypothetical protein GGX14DRAFT_394893 [Mycena pura]|uniref:Uncharacterized protein n=1 Tax=Mycena pura TaxID=153505 RepID=A0AAD6VHX6_9AGAR|nr:hypothetical protein GGX14DRAFT_394893 [Mycena pura]
MGYGKSGDKYGGSYGGSYGGKYGGRSPLHRLQPHTCIVSPPLPHPQSRLNTSDDVQKPLQESNRGGGKQREPRARAAGSGWQTEVCCVSESDVARHGCMRWALRPARVAGCERSSRGRKRAGGRRVCQWGSSVMRAHNVRRRQGPLHAARRPLFAARTRRTLPDASLRRLGYLDNELALFGALDISGYARSGVCAKVGRGVLNVSSNAACQTSRSDACPAAEWWRAGLFADMPNTNDISKAQGDPLHGCG